MNINEKRRTKGITLVALVITIVVMLILAGVAINLTIDSNGLFGKANTAGEEWNNAIGKEQSDIQDLLDLLGVEVPMPEGWDSNKIGSLKRETSTITGTEKTRIVPIPKGYIVSGISTESTIAGGLVIYEIPEGATVDWANKTITIEETTSNLQETVNQYVWIPVDDINYMVMCKSNSSSSQCNLVLQANGTLKCKTHNSTDLCGRIYATDSTTTDTEAPKTYTTNMQFTEEARASQTWNTGYREPDIVSDYDKDDIEETTYMAMAGITSGKVADFQKQLTDDFIAMATSVAKYGGFYVSRYEVGENGASKKNQKVITAASSTAGNYIGVNTWYGLYSALYREIEVGTSTIQSHMIYGSQYDQIINFLETNSNNEPQIGHTGRQLAAQKLTGANEINVMSNIYDLEGNNLEWIAQAYASAYRVFRGSAYNDAKKENFYPASDRTILNPTNTLSNYTSRASLYL